MDFVSLLLLAVLSFSALPIFYLREELGIAAVLLLGCYFAPLQNSIISNPHYLLDRLLDFFLYSFLIAVILLKNRSDKRFRIIKTPLNLPIIFFLGSILVTGIFSLILFSQTPGLVFMGLMDMSPYIMFFPIIYGIKNVKQLNFIIVFIFAIAIVSAIFTIIASFDPDSPFAFAIAVEKWGFGSYYYRTFSYAIHVIVLVFLVSVSILPFLKSGFVKVLLLWVTLTLFFAIILTFTRSLWVPMVITIAGLAALLPRKKIGRYSRWLITIAVMVVIAGIYLNYYLPSFNYGGIIPTVREGFLSSFKAFQFTDGLTAEPSFNARILEAQIGMDVIKNNLITGVGYKYRLDTAEATVSYLHNGYVSILMVQGLIGFIPFMWLIITFFFRSLKIYRSLNESLYKGLVLGFTGGFWFTLMYAFLGNGLQHGKVLILVLMLIMGLSEVIYKLNKASEICTPG